MISISRNRIWSFVRQSSSSYSLFILSIIIQLSSYRIFKKVTIRESLIRNIGSYLVNGIISINTNQLTFMISFLCLVSPESLIISLWRDIIQILIVILLILYFKVDNSIENCTTHGNCSVAFTCNNT